MKLLPALHRWSLSSSRAAAIQRELARRVRIEPLTRPVRLIAGLDVAFSTDGADCLGGVVLWDLAERRIIEQHVARRRLQFPYVPGLLSFREAPALLAALRQLRTTPDLLMCDGQGLAHPRRFGIACHLGVLCDLPSVGCAKSRLIGEHEVPPPARGAAVPLHHRNEIIGTVLRTQTDVRPLYVSVGHRINLESTQRLVLDCSVRYRLPEPTRLADQLAARAKRGEGPGNLVRLPRAR
jgi:deoxyribonuclease V